MSPTYKIRRIYNKVFFGITAPVACSLDAILKRDNLESPYCVYNELVAVRLAQTINIPVATGVLTQAKSQYGYASIELALPGLRLPDLLPTQFAAAKSRYPDEAVALVLFDILIGNWDRGSNLKVSFVNPHYSIFQGFDHEHALLSVESDPVDSIRTLGGKNLIVIAHPFYGRMDPRIEIKWLNRFSAIDDAMILECCELGHPLGNVTVDMQRSLGEALCKRKSNLREIIVKNASHINQLK